MKSKIIVVANWKMYINTSNEAKKLSDGIAKVMKAVKNVDLVLAPSFVHIPFMKLQGKKVFLGSQDVHTEDKGPFTGQVSIHQLQSLGVKYSIVGHSEKRALGDTDEMVNRKVKVLLKAKVTPIICIGELARDTQGVYLSFLENQLMMAFAGVTRADALRSIIAYEPVWAIGKSAEDSMKSQDVHEIVLFIQKVLSQMYGRDTSKKIPILYGGAVEEENAKTLIIEGKVAGLLVGHASISVKTLGPILETINTII